MRIPPCGNYGDVDGDGNVTMADGMYVARHSLAGDELYPMTPAQKQSADVDGDGNVTMADGDLITKYAMADIGTFPVCIEGTSPATKMIVIFATAAVVMYVFTKLLWK